MTARRRLCREIIESTARSLTGRTTSKRCSTLHRNGKSSPDFHSCRAEPIIPPFNREEFVMAWDKSRVTLFPPRWRPSRDVAKHGRTANGPVQILHSQREEAVLADAIDAEAVAAWLLERRFDKRQEFVKIATLGREDIEVDLFTLD